MSLAYESVVFSFFIGGVIGVFFALRVDKFDW
ncbi:hypothetical protein MNBD_GAMMA16-746 [hydrothermal vent metagenome]|uniref:Uncharacterized protein n=1 Tax=hydrothermal vent metagenome TaxID=652676 RepID=A0A3B0YXH6_9ZZZZ